MGQSHPIPSHGTTWFFEISHGMGWDDLSIPWDGMGRISHPMGFSSFFSHEKNADSFLMKDGLKVLYRNGGS
jgi:hypothetical protein